MADTNTFTVVTAETKYMHNKVLSTVILYYIQNILSLASLWADPGVL